MSTPNRRGHASPEPTIVPVSRLADRILTGEIVLPKYQRAFVWAPHQIRHLLDSVLRNYPIGSLLLWETTEQLANEETVAVNRDPVAALGVMVLCLVRVAGVTRL